MNKTEKDERYKWICCSCLNKFVDMFSNCFCFLLTRVLWKKNEVADGEAMTFSIFYNNTLYLLLVLLFFYFWRSIHPGLYPL